jgi:hypothetical protein
MRGCAFELMATIRELAPDRIGDIIIPYFQGWFCEEWGHATFQGEVLLVPDINTLEVGHGLMIICFLMR